LERGRRFDCIIPPGNAHYNERAATQHALQATAFTFG
jgi:hypothetical protein